MFIREIFLSDKREKSTYKHLSITKVNYLFFIFNKKWHNKSIGLIEWIEIEKRSDMFFMSFFFEEEKRSRRKWSFRKRRK